MPAQADSKDPRIVAGVDGSPSSLSALRWAIRQAGLTGAAVDALIAWQDPNLAASGGYGIPGGGIEPAYAFREPRANPNTDTPCRTPRPGTRPRANRRTLTGGGGGHPTAAGCCLVPATTPPCSTGRQARPAW